MKKTAARQTHPLIAAALSTIPDVRGNGYLRETIAAQGDLLSHLDALRALVPYLISVGLFAARENGALSTIETVAMHRFGGEAAQQKLGRMVRSGAEDDACGEAFNMLTAGATAGYLVGLAVGQAIGPEALKGSPR